MKRRLFEDQQSPDTDRQVSGVGPGAKNPGTPGGMTAADFLQQRNELTPTMNGIPYPLEAIETAMADVFVDLSNLSKMLDIAKLNPVLSKKSNHVEDLNDLIKNMAKKLVDFNEKLAIIKGDE
jgi:hypothetical protein|tara:strand:- start:1661 stop:2029 length:369 start_codon:yes stop_codon:yes gene_type:complete